MDCRFRSARTRRTITKCLRIRAQRAVEYRPAKLIIRRPMHQIQRHAGRRNGGRAGVRCDARTDSLSTNFRAGRFTTGNVMASGLQVLFGEFAKLIGNGSRRSQHDRSVSDCIPSETIADHVDSAVCRPARHPSLGARPAFFIFKPQRKFQLHLPVLLKMRHGDRQQRYGLLLRVIGERRTNELFGDFGKGSGR